MAGHLSRMDGIDVHYIEAATGRIVITQEAESIKDEVDGLKRIRALPGIILAEMSYHNFEEDQELVDAIPEEIDSDDKVPAFLNK
jgi:nitrate reductase NapD